MLADSKIMKFPIKIGDLARVYDYSKTLTHGEEQLLITRDCKFYLTIGDGTYKEFPTVNTGMTESQIKNLVNTLDKEMLDKINDTRLSVTNLADDIRVQFLKYITRDEYNLKIKEIEDDIELEKHSNRQVLDLFSEDKNGYPLYNGKVIVTDFDTTNLVRQNEFDSFKTETNDSILILDDKIEENQQSTTQELSLIKTDIVDINKEVLELKETTAIIKDSINDFSEHTSLPSFSINATISRIS